MKKPHLYKRLSKYKTSKCLIEFGLASKDEIHSLLKKRQYVENPKFWMKGFVKVTLLESMLLIEHDIKNNKNGIRCFYNKDIFLEFLQYFEKKMI